MESISIYKCPVCGKRTLTNAAMCSHMCNVFWRPAPFAHYNWMEKRGIESCFRASGQGCYKPIKERVEKECKI